MRTAAPAPAVTLRVGGTTLDPAIHQAVASVRVARRLSLPAQCEVALALTHLGSGTPDRFFAIGDRLEVLVANDSAPLFAGDVTAHEWVHGPDGSTELRVRAYDELHRLRKQQRIVARTEVTVADVARELAGEVGLDAAVDAGSTARWPVLIQRGRSELDLLQWLTEASGLWFAIVDGTLRVLSLGGFDEPIQLTIRDSLLAATFEASADPACRVVRTTGWDPVAAGGMHGEAEHPRVGRAVGADLDPGLVGGDGQRVIVDHRGPTADHLDEAAQAELDREVAREVTVRGTAEGDARLQPGRRVQIAGVHPGVAGTYVLTETTHTLDAAGYLVDISSAPPPQRPPLPASAEVTLGLVASADDPAGLGRVRLSLPGFGDVETDWRHVITPGAGSGKGLVTTPDAGDRVVALLPGGDPASAIVLGGIYGDAGCFDPGVVAGEVQRWTLRTPGGQHVVLDDAAGRAFVANHDGSSVLLEPDQVTIHAAADLVIQAPGRTMTLRANRIEMEQASSEECSPTAPLLVAADPGG